MARGNPPRNARARNATRGNGAAEPRPRPVIDDKPRAAKSPIRSGVDTLFDTDQGVRDALSTRLKERSDISHAHKARAEAAFANFSPSRLSAEERARPEYFAPGDDLHTAHEKVFTEGAAAMRASGVSRSMTLRLNDSLKGLITENAAGGDSLAGTIPLKDLVEYMTGRPTSVPALISNPTLNACKAQVEAERRMAAIEGGAAPNGGGGGGGGGPDGNGAGDADAAELVKNKVNVQMDTVTSPESQLRYAVPSRSDQSELQKGIQTFELRAGASDVTSYHDFSTLQIAFQSVWTEIFHGKLSQLGQELYHEYVKLKEFAGVDAADRQIDTLDDLKALMDEVKSLSNITQDAIPWQPRGGGGNGGGDGVAVSSTSVGDFAKAVLDPASIVVGAIGDKTVEAIVDPAGAAIDVISSILADKQKITWDNFPGPLPGLPNGQNMITPIFDENAVADGEIEIVLSASTGAPWKGLGLWEFDAAGNLQTVWKISNDPRDTDVWDTTQVGRLPLYTPQIQYGILEFDSETYFGVHHGYFLLSDLPQKIKNRTRVTFAW
jgi:hypothetical protein